jgi:hypothetical protein
MKMKFIICFWRKPFHLDVANATQNLNSDYNKFWGIFHNEVKQNMITSSVNSVYDAWRKIMTARDLNDLTPYNQETFLTCKSFSMEMDLKN